MTEFSERFKKFLSSLAGMILLKASLRDIELYIDMLLTQLYKSWFAQNMLINVGLVESELITLSNFYKVPYKFNKDVFLNIKGRSLLSSDTTWTTAYTQKEINTLKRIISRALYEKKNETEIADILSRRLKVGSNKAKLIARTEVSRCKNTALSMYYDTLDKSIYRKKWVSQHDTAVRPEHAQMDGKIADPVTGIYATVWGEYMSEPGTGNVVEQNINCRCNSEIVKIASV